MVEVILEYDATCPRCKRLEFIVREVCNMLNVPFIPKLVRTHSIAFEDKDSARRTFSEEWVRRFGSPSHKRLLRVLKPVFELINRYDISSTPVLKIRYRGAYGVNEIIIRGFVDDKKLEERFRENLIILLYDLKRVERKFL